MDNYLVRAQTSPFARLFGSPRTEVTVTGDGISIIREGAGATVQYGSIMTAQAGRGLLWKTLHLIDESGTKKSISGLSPRAADTTAATVRARLSGPLVENALRAFDLPDGRDQYLTHARLQEWLSEATELAKRLEPRVQRLPLPERTRDDIARFLEILQDPETAREKRNREYVAAALGRYAAWFDTGQSYPLTSAQRNVIVQDEGNCLVIAGAGSGKTTTIVGKVGYLVKSGLAKPEEILLLAFTRKAKVEMEERLEKLGIFDICVRTFHALGLDVIAVADGKKPSLTKFASDQLALTRFISAEIDRLFRADPHGLVTTFLAFNRYPYRGHHEFESAHMYTQYLRGHDVRSLRGEKVKSIEECLIANWLLMHGIEYEYERPYEYDTASVEYRQYTPDFYLPKYNIYIEHFALNKAGQPPKFFRKPTKYLAEMKWKRGLHGQYGTTLLETFSHEKADGVLLKNLRDKLVAHNVDIVPMEADKLEQFINNDEVLAPLSILVSSFLALFKSNCWRVDELRELAKQGNDSERKAAFVSLFEAILGAYQDEIKYQGMIDFHDMINLATIRVKEGAYKSRFRYILVDEFQDISRGRTGLLAALCGAVDDRRLFCVGDDWQSIYRFTGSDIGLILSFEETFGYTHKAVLEDTYRFNQELLYVSSRFIQTNPLQLKKELRSPVESEAPALMIVAKRSSETWEESLDGVLKGILDENAADNIDVLVLGRYHHSVPENWRRLRTGGRLRVRVMTVHAAKGLEADYTVIMDVTAGRHGFPSEIVDDPLLEMLLSQHDECEHAEERRLFYVAITRSRVQTYVLTDEWNESVFVEELSGAAYAGRVAAPERRGIAVSCPQCQGGRLRERKNEYGVFWICSNYPYCNELVRPCAACGEGPFVREQNIYRCRNEACGVKADVCPECGVGALIVVHGRYGDFLGCTEWRREGAACFYKRNLRPR